MHSADDPSPAEFSQCRKGEQRENKAASEKLRPVEVGLIRRFGGSSSLFRGEGRAALPQEIYSLRCIDPSVGRIVMNREIGMRGVSGSDSRSASAQPGLKEMMRQSNSGVSTPQIASAGSGFPQGTLDGPQGATPLETIHASCRPKPKTRPVPVIPNRQGAQIPKVGQPTVCKPTYEDAAKRVLSQVKFFDEKLHDHQNAVFTGNANFRTEMERHKGTGVTYIHVDTHSDVIFGQAPFFVSIANHLPETILTNPEITEVYWVTKSSVIEFAATSTQSHIPDRFLGDKKDVRIFVHKETNRVIYESPAKTSDAKGIVELKSNVPSDIENYRVVTIRRREARELPDFKDKPVIANLDLDYFSNTGYDTAGKINHGFQESEVTSFFEIFDKKNVRPFAVLTCLSPRYTPLEDVRIRQLSSDLEDYTGQQDLYATYARTEPQNGDMFSESNILATSNKAYLLARQLLKLDLNTETPDANIALKLSDNPEFKSAVLKTKEIYNLTNDEEALFVLRQLDVRDGVKDNVVNLWNWPNLVHYDSSIFKNNTPLSMAKPGELIGLETVFQYEAIQVRQREIE